MRRLSATLLLATAMMLSTAVAANADPTRHWAGTFRIQCGSDVMVLVAKPGSSAIVSINGEPTNSINILMGLTVIVDGQVVEEFHKPITEHQTLISCISLDEPPGVQVLAEALVTPRR